MERKKLIITSVVLVLVLAIGGILAYFTDTDTKSNNIKLGNVDIELVESLWTGGKTNVMPGEELAKNPIIENKGESPVYVFAEVVVPRASVKVGNAASASATDLYTYTLGTGWVEVGTAVSTATATTHVYAWGNATAMTAVAKDGATTTLFADNKVKLVNITETADTAAADSVQNTAKNIVINAYGIQTTGLGVTAPADVWAKVK